MGKRRVLRVTAGAVLLVVLMILTALPVRADNCGSFSDCFGTTQAAIAALVAAAILVAILIVALPALLAAAAEAEAAAAEAEAAAAAEAEAAAAEAEAAAAEAEAAAAEAEGLGEGLSEGAGEGFPPEEPPPPEEPYTDPSNLENQTARRYAERMYNSIEDHLTPKDLEGAWRDVHGDPVPNPSTGWYYDHLDEVDNAMRSIRNSIEEFKDLLNDPGLSSNDRAIIQDLLSKGSKTLDYVVKVVNRSQWYPGTKIPFP